MKFSQRVVLAQTASPDGGRRVCSYFRPLQLFVQLLILFKQNNDSLDISLAMVPPDHTLIPQRSLEAEASGLLDRMLEVLRDKPT
jgi:symplekin